MQRRVEKYYDVVERAAITRYLTRAYQRGWRSVRDDIWTHEK